VYLLEMLGLSPGLGNPSSPGLHRTFCADRRVSTSSSYIIPELMKTQCPAWSFWARGGQSSRLGSWPSWRIPDEDLCHHRLHRDLSHVIQAGSDIFLMPSRYEPCGLTHDVRLSYGTPQWPRQLAALRDTISPFQPKGPTGSYSPTPPRGPLAAVREAVAVWEDGPPGAGFRSSHETRFSWEDSARKVYGCLCIFARRPRITMEENMEHREKISEDQERLPRDLSPSQPKQRVEPNPPSWWASSTMVPARHSHEAPQGRILQGRGGFCRAAHRTSSATSSTTTDGKTTGTPTITATASSATARIPLVRGVSGGRVRRRSIIAYGLIFQSGKP
jgi:hypothetical protein